MSEIQIEMSVLQHRLEIKIENIVAFSCWHRNSRLQVLDFTQRTQSKMSGETMRTVTLTFHALIIAMSNLPWPSVWHKDQAACMVA